MTDSQIPVVKNNAKAIKLFFEREGGAKVTMAEMKALSTEEREELGTLALAELNRLGISL